MEQLLGEVTLTQVLTALLLLCVFLGLAWLSRIFVRKAARELAQKTKTKLDGAVVSALGKWVVVILVFTGLYLAAIVLPLAAPLRSYLLKGLYIILSLMGIYAVLVFLDTLTKRYGQELVVGKGNLTRRFFNLFRVILIVIGAGAAVIVSLSILGVELTWARAWLGEHGWRIFLIILLAMTTNVAIARLVVKIITIAVARGADESDEEVTKRADTLSRVLGNVSQAVVVFVAIFMVLSELDIDITPILAGVGVVGIALGFGAQSLVKDIFTGLFIILDDEYRVGDVVSIAGVAGFVVDINLRRTVMRDLDGVVHVVPNGEIRVASNFTKEWSRVNLNVSVAYKENIDHVMSVINRVGKELAEDPQWAPSILKAPQALRVDNFGSSGIEIKILGETKPIRQWDVTGELRKRLKKAFDEEGIEIPLPHTKVYFGNTPFPPGDLPSSGGQKAR